MFLNKKNPEIIKKNSTTDKPMTKMIVYFSKKWSWNLNNNPKWNSMISNVNTNLKNQHYKNSFSFNTSIFLFLICLSTCF